MHSVSPEHNQWHKNTFGMIPLDEGSVRRMSLYIRRICNHTRQTSMPPPTFEPAIPTSEQRKTHALHRVTTGTGRKVTSVNIQQSDIMRWNKCGWEGDVYSATFFKILHCIAIYLVECAIEFFHFVHIVYSTVTVQFIPSIIPTNKPTVYPRTVLG